MDRTAFGGQPDQQGRLQDQAAALDQSTLEEFDSVLTGTSPSTMTEKTLLRKVTPPTRAVVKEKEAKERKARARVAVVERMTTATI